LDTSAEAWERQLDAFRRMTPQERLRIAVAMSAEVRALAEAGIRSRNPELSGDEVEAALADILLGHELAGATRRSRFASAR
jgi:hypothetical protein